MIDEIKDEDLNLEEDDIDSGNTDIDQDDDLKDIKAEDIDKIEDPEKLKELAKKSVGLKQKFYDRARTTADKFKQYKEKYPPNKSKSEDDPGNQNNKSNKKEISDDIAETNKRLDNLEMVEKKRDFGYQNGLSPEETDQVFRMTNNNPTKKDLDSPFIKGGLDALRKSNRIKDNTPEPGAGIIVEGKSWEKMSPEEKKKNFPEYMRQKRKAIRG